MPLRIAGARSSRALAFGGGVLALALVGALVGGGWRDELIVAAPAVGFVAILLAVTLRRLPWLTWRRALATIRNAAAGSGFFHESVSPTIVLNADGTVRFGSPTIAALLGYPTGRLEAETLGTLVSPADSAEILALAQAPHGARDHRDS